MTVDRLNIGVQCNLPMVQLAEASDSDSDERQGDVSAFEHRI